MRIPLLPTLALIAAFAPACAAAHWYPPLEGVVVEEGSAKPLAGAFVIAKWVGYGGDLVGSRTSCAHLEIARSDELGRFRIPGYFLASPSRLDRGVYPYRPGYEITADGVANPQRLVMAPFRGEARARFRSVLSHSHLQECARGADARPVLGSLYEELDRELAALRLSDPRIEPSRGFAGLLNP